MALYRPMCDRVAIFFFFEKLNLVAIAGLFKHTFEMHQKSRFIVSEIDYLFPRRYSTQRLNVDTFRVGCCHLTILGKQDFTTGSLHCRTLN
jgi:hypothetical protein